MVVERIDDLLAECVARGCRRRVSLVLLTAENIICGDHVLVHQGLAMRTVSAEEADLIWEAFDLATSTEEQAAPV